VIAAAGSGERLGAGGPKAFIDLAGRPLLAWSLAAMAEAETIGSIVIAAPPGAESRAAEIAEGVGVEVSVVPGGESRSASVAAGVAETAGEVVAVHDAARPLVEASLIDAVVSRLEANPELSGVVAAIPATDTVKEASVSRRVVRTLDRDRVWMVQTPQAFRAARLVEVYSRTGERELEGATDDAMLIEHHGGDLLLEQGSPRNLKVTTPLDMRVAEALLSEPGV